MHQRTLHRKHGISFRCTSVQARPTRGYQQPTAHTPAPAVTPTPTPTPTATPTPSGNNLMSVTDGNWYTDMQWINAPCSQYGEIIDTTATYDGSPSWQITLNPNGWGVDWCPSGCVRQPIAPGDKIYYSFWIETSVATLSSDVGNPHAGARIGIDFYGPNGQTGILILRILPQHLIRMVLHQAVQIHMSSLEQVYGHKWQLSLLYLLLMFI